MRKIVPFRLVCFCSLLLLCFGIIGSSMPQMEANPDFVTETENYIQIENNYFIAQIHKGTHGSIKYFYIKPEDTVNIVAPESGGFEYLGGHEALEKWGTDYRASSDWMDASKQSYSTQIVHQDSDSVTVESIVRFRRTGSNWDYSVFDYKTFYADKPFYLGATARKYNEDCAFMDNYQYCFLYDDVWGDTYVWLNKTLGISNTTDNYEEEIWWAYETQFIEQYPWIMMYNTSYNLGHFTMLISGNPPTVGLGYMGTRAGRFREYQIDWGQRACKSGDETWAVYVSGVAENTTYVNDLSESLWDNTVVRENYPRIVRFSGDNETNITDGNVVQALNFYEEYWFYGTTGKLYIGYHKPFWLHSHYRYGGFYAQYKNSTDTYELLKHDALTSYSQEWNGTYQKLEYERDFEGKIRLTVTMEMWADSDPLLMTFNFTTLADINVEFLRVQWYGGQTNKDQNLVYLNASVMKLNGTDYYYPEIGEEGIIFQNTTDNVNVINKQVGIYLNGYWYGLNQTEAQVGSGNSYILTLKVQHYRHWLDEGLGEFSLTDVLPLHQRSMDRYEKNVWARFPFYDLETPFRINHLGGNHWVTSDISYDSNSLSFKVHAPTGNTSIVKFYVGVRGEPSRVCATNGPLAWSYNASTKTLELSVLHHGLAEITVDWRMPGDVDGDGDVDLDDLYYVLIAYGAMMGDPDYDPNVDIDDDGEIDLDDLYQVLWNYGT